VETEAVTFQGATYEPRHDKERLTRQLDRVRECMLEKMLPEHTAGQWLTLSELVHWCGGSEAGISARLRDLRKPQFGGYIVERRRRGDPKRGLFEYRLLPPVVGAQQELRL
jgi:hypothetical protein